jgi:L-arabonate dehydrase
MGTIPNSNYPQKTAKELKPSAGTPALLKHRGRAAVFETVEEPHEKVNDENLEIDETCIMLLKGAGPKGYPVSPRLATCRFQPRSSAKGPPTWCAFPTAE